ncbi:MAG: HU family DNA-binding protein [Candidatus Ancillula trichonymphae]|jgi:DNA-binding protein HU-beta|nr:HU family DNA-binding protein [Candidatus Ancillula trichonymphae]
MALNKIDIVEKIASKGGLSKADAECALNAFVDVFLEAVAKDGEFGITGIFKAQVKDTAARTAKNPRTGEPISVPAGKAVRIKVGNTLKAAVK